MLTDMKEDGHLTYQCPHCTHAPHTHHVSHEAIQYQAGDATMIDLPVCPCGTKMALKVVQPEWELLPPIIDRDENGAIRSVLIQGATNKIIIHEHAELREINGERVPVRIIDSVTWPVPWVTHHANLVKHMEASGKTVPEHIEVPVEPMIPLSQVTDLVQSILRQHGIDPLEDTSKRAAITGNVVTSPEQG